MTAAKVAPLDPDTERGQRIAEALSEVQADVLERLAREGQPWPACFTNDSAQAGAA